MKRALDVLVIPGLLLMSALAGPVGALALAPVGHEQPHLSLRHEGPRALGPVGENLDARSLVRFQCGPEDVVAGGATKIFTNAPAGRVLLGSPAMKMETHVEAMKGLRRLPRLYRQVAELQKAVSKTDPSD